jgi:hypothetical protein
MAKGPAVDWMVSVAEFLMSTYPMTLTDAVFRFSLLAAFALMPAAADRQGSDLGDRDLVERARSRARREREAEIRRTYRIIPNPAP